MRTNASKDLNHHDTHNRKRNNMAEDKTNNVFVQFIGRGLRRHSHDNLGSDLRLEYERLEKRFKKLRQGLLILSLQRTNRELMGLSDDIPLPDFFNGSDFSIQAIRAMAKEILANDE